MADFNDRSAWDQEDEYWRTNYKNRPYASSGSSDYENFRPGYRYGHESASRYQGRNWDDVEKDLSTDWDKYEHRGNSTWEQVKGAVRDAWDRMTGNKTTSSRS